MEHMGGIPISDKRDGGDVTGRASDVPDVATRRCSACGEDREIVEDIRLGGRVVHVFKPCGCASHPAIETMRTF